MANYLTCKHNTYVEINVDWVDCSHPVTIAKTPRWQEGDPAWVNHMTADVPFSRIDEIGSCPAYEPKESPDEQR